MSNQNQNMVITFGEIMLRLTPPANYRLSQATTLDISYAGSEANVAVSLANFGVPVDFVTWLPKNELGDNVVKELIKYNVGINEIKRHDGRLGVMFVEKGVAQRPGKVVYDRTNSSFTYIEKGDIDWNKIFKNAKWFHWSGISPGISQKAADVCLEAIQEAKKRNLTVSVDFNYRQKLWQYDKKMSDVMPELVAGCDILLCNEYDAKTALNIVPDGLNTANENFNKATYLSVCQQIMKKYPGVKKIVSSKRTSINASHNKWSGLMYDGKKMFDTVEYDINPIVDRLGTGDSFMAGIIYGIMVYKGNNQKTLDFAVAASCLKHTIDKDFNMVSIEDIEDLMNGNSAGRISR